MRLFEWGKKGAGSPARPPRLGIAFGGGALKGLAHVGVIKVLEEYGIHADLVSGTSIGSAIAAMYAAGLSAQQMEGVFNSTDMDNMLKVRPGKMGLIPAEGYVGMMRAATGSRRIEDMDIPLYIVAVDLVSRRQIVFDKGDTALLVRASSAIPGVMTPVPLGDMVLVDGFITDNCPGDVLRQQGAEVVLAIDLFMPKNTPPRNMLEVVDQALNMAAASRQTIDADIILRPIDVHKDGLNKDIMDECLALGEACGRAHIGEILRLLGRAE